jgi:hypothetical protein
MQTTNSRRTVEDFLKPVIEAASSPRMSGLVGIETVHALTNLVKNDSYESKKVNRSRRWHGLKSYESIAGMKPNWEQGS